MKIITTIVRLRRIAMISFMINAEKWSEANLPVRRIYIFGRIWTPFVREKGPIGF